MTSYECLLPVNGGWKNDVTNWLSEDVPSFDFGGYVVGTDQKTSTLLMKSNGVLSGVPFATEVFRQCNLAVEWHFQEGTYIDVSKSNNCKVSVATVSGKAKDILLAERTSLNILSRASGIASASSKIIGLARKSGYTGIIAGTRKTTPGLRRLEKYSMLIGGCDSHRYDLSSMVMLKDNHIWSRGSITNAVIDARRVCGFAVKIEVECQSETEADEAITAGADIIMLDNFEHDDLKLCAKSLKQKWVGRKHFMLECSGGLTLENIDSFLCSDIDIYSTSSIHQGVSVVDFSLKLDH
ncbi:similar to Saccharomyces cerevisiae YFR047C BNA6 Quinolinate phosphoribosyl transferase, required for the de novo biosynthesis of NAD from tryptophan via kynurenine [Maudiozyma barnettii]|uniref:Nicotinate-nucleotide pyrophosphorylase [carboxylating] n=1 Tax=Maudiozyma barnettii TaxID=61262 RepID=A0A8H2VIT0_9SACH|nr:nicotinate-nucleotide diphosphorylase (carboxylating) [Kazachstania barnettii]CAB4256227.1 similar to Saccharomyces cerevisiae YFR047C BNA6 Quinolinate phosphoribosyl transferase, required for the de novo biosynthesis of NAD from tryptophan via kynurenine [Kazachstania barnettii]CAD1784836.1 similar to Saccharomyces cerevisiae YFR047C BNA6 Quinolinate phosphoribosyl transferase, required for the de novo biosynthesis of NAD from tryptophan via kynurenine [Kazachstania barnettii]